jgi:hypothetical protein
MPEGRVSGALVLEVNADATMLRSVVTFGRAKSWKALSRPVAQRFGEQRWPGLRAGILTTLSDIFKRPEAMAPNAFILSP